MDTRVRAVISEEGKILLIHRKKNDREYYVFPGGGMEENDSSFENTIIRECKEELGVNIEIVDAFGVDETSEKKEIFFKCRITGGKLGSGDGPEYNPESGYKGTYALVWEPIANLENLLVYPESIRDKVVKEMS